MITQAEAKLLEELQAIGIRFYNLGLRKASVAVYDLMDTIKRDLNNEELPHSQ